MGGSQDEPDSMDIFQNTPAPENAPLSAIYRGSFAYLTIKERCPIILTKTIDQIARDKKVITDCYKDGNVQDEIKKCIGELSELKYQLVTSKEFTKFTSNDPDKELWNKELTRRECHINTFFQSDWLFAECYLYRRIREVFANKTNLNSYDPFAIQKHELLKKSLEPLMPVVNHLINDRIIDSTHILSMNQLSEELSSLIKYSLWANRLDLSLNFGETNFNHNPLTNLSEWDSNILVDDSFKIFPLLFSKSTSEKVVDIVMDNAGFEALCDLCLALFLTEKCSVSRIRFRVKPIPWFISDVIPRDLRFTVETATKQNGNLSDLGHRWKKYFDTEKWTIHSDQFWCLGLPYSRMVEDDLNLYEELQKSDLIIFKGDLNYRKLVGDRNWCPSISFREALCGFHPAPLLAIRTNKADTIAGVNNDIIEKITEPDWLTTGKYGVIQFDAPNQSMDSITTCTP